MIFGCLFCESLEFCVFACYLVSSGVLWMLIFVVFGCRVEGCGVFVDVMVFNLVVL